MATACPRAALPRRRWLQLPQQAREAQGQREAQLPREHPVLAQLPRQHPVLVVLLRRAPQPLQPLPAEDLQRPL
jgi:hypothetical protein